MTTNSVVPVSATSSSVSYTQDTVIAAFAPATRTRERLGLGRGAHHHSSAHATAAPAIIPSITRPTMPSGPPKPNWTARRSPRELPHPPRSVSSAHPALHGASRNPAATDTHRVPATIARAIEEVHDRRARRLSLAVTRRDTTQDGFPRNLRELLEALTPWPCASNPITLRG